MKFLIVDDEPLQLETLVEYVTEFYPSAKIHGYSDVAQALKLAETEKIDVAILDISLPGTINGINFGEMLRKKNKRVRILYCSGYSSYAIEAFKMHANGYLQKPILKEDLKQELLYIMQMPVFGSEDKPYIHTFGNFDIYYGNRPVSFRRSKSKGVLAYLTDREGSWVTNKELMAILWEETVSDSALSKYITTVVKDMIADLERAGIGHIVERQRGSLRLLKDEVACDYFDYLNKDEDAISRFRGEYMAQYSWAEATLASLLQIKPNKK